MNANATLPVIGQVHCPEHGAQGVEAGQCWLCAANERMAKAFRERRLRKQQHQQEIAFRQLPAGDR